MNIPRFVLAIVAAFIFIFLSDYVIHAIWLMPDYKATSSLWRSDAEMMARFPWMVTAQFLCAATFVTIWAVGLAGRGSMGLATGYGLLMGLFAGVSSIISYVVTPMPPVLSTKWFFSGLAQGLVLGIIAFFAYKPAPRMPA